jgi:hypothetical protein
MSVLATRQWHCSRAQLAQALAAARSVHTRADRHIHALLPPGAHPRPALRLFAEVERAYPSFSSWWSRVTRGLRRLEDLPGLQALADQASAARAGIQP